MRSLYCILTLLFTTVAASAQTAAETDSVKATINRMFTAMRNADTLALKDCFAPGGVLQTAIKDQDGRVNIRTTPVTGFASRIGSLPKNAADERITFDMIQIDMPLASVWTSYQFYYQGKFSHCGVNSFQLVKLAEGWKIQYIIDTRRKDACKESPAAK